MVETQRHKGTDWTSLCLCVSVFILVFLAGTSYANPWGKDADLAIREKCSVSEPQRGPLIAFADTMIGFHKKVISPADGPRSHFRPNSSQYTLDAIHKYGFFYGCLLGFDRLMRENRDPWVYPTIVNEEGFITKWDPVR